MPTFISCHVISHTAIPEGLDGMTVLHLSDFHIRYPLDATGRRRHRWMDQLLADIASVTVDVVALTGDYIDRPGDEPLGLDLLALLARTWNLKPGGQAVGVFGNHDTPYFRRAARQQTEKTNIHWLEGAPIRIPLRPQAPPLTISGLDFPEDFLSTFPHQPPIAPLIMLVHEPTALIPAAADRVPILLAGHTHGGQVRLTPGFAPHTSSDTPHHLAAGITRLENTLCAISRGVGDGVVEGLRINCPRQIPLYTLHRGPLPGASSQTEPTQVVPW